MAKKGKKKKKKKKKFITLHQAPVIDAKSLQPKGNI